MSYDPKLHHRRTVRLHDYDYSQSGAYFVTICTEGRNALFGTLVQDGEPSVALNEAGLAVRRFWMEIPRHFPLVLLDEFLVMPDHLHGILLLGGEGDSLGRSRGANDYSPLQDGTTRTVGSVIRGFKIGVTKWFNENGSTADKVWQRSFYEHVIRNEQELQATRQYIQENPLRTVLRLGR